MSVSVFADALSDVRQYFEEFPEIAAQASAIAINDVAERGGMVAIRREMRRQINFPKGYLENGRLRLVGRANPRKLEARIRGRDRATSLARFAAGQTPENTRGRGVRLKVKGMGGVQVRRRAFLMRLRNGNIGLAIRLKPGQTPRNTENAVYIGGNQKHLANLWLLYGPSVDQVFQGVSSDVAPDILSLVTREFFRQFTRMSRRG